MPQSLPSRTHAFFATDGRLLRVAEREDGFHLEANAGSIGLCRITGPEILKLSEQGRALWRVCKQLFDVAYAAGLRDATGSPGPISEALSVLDATAQTFDHNEPEVPRGDD